MPVFNRITIVGLGLIGGSLGMAARRRHLAGTVVGLSRRRRTLQIAKKRGAIDVGTNDPHLAVEESDLVILATPVDAIVPHALLLSKWMRPGSILTDVGSTKGEIVKTLERRLAPHVAFVGAHPLAGSEHSGITWASAGLFDGSSCIISSTRRTDAKALLKVRSFWSHIAARVIVMDPAHHDRLLASASHLPHLLAFCLMEAAAKEVLSIAPRSFMDATRVAKSDPKLWDGIFLTNRMALLDSFDAFDKRLRLMRSLLKKRDRAGLRRLLARAKAKRDKIGNERS